MHRHRCTFTATRTPLTLARRMTDARLSVTLPEYETELAATQRTAMRNAALLAAPLLVAFTFLDRRALPGPRPRHIPSPSPSWQGPGPPGRTGCAAASTAPAPRGRGRSG